MLAKLLDDAKQLEAFKKWYTDGAIGFPPPKLDHFMADILKRCDKASTNKEFGPRAAKATQAIEAVMAGHREELDAKHRLVEKRWKKARFVVKPLNEHMDKRATQKRALQCMRAVLDR